MIESISCSTDYSPFRVLILARRSFFCAEFTDYPLFSSDDCSVRGSSHSCVTSWSWFLVAMAVCPLLCAWATLIFLLFFFNSTFIRCLTCQVQVFLWLYVWLLWLCSSYLKLWFSSFFSSWSSAAFELLHKPPNNHLFFDVFRESLVIHWIIKAPVCILDLCLSSLYPVFLSFFISQPQV